MNITVSARIFGGFALTLLFTVGIFFVAIFSIGSINSSLQEVTDESVPLLEGGAEFTSSLLDSQVALVAFFNAEQASIASTAKARYGVSKVANEQAYNRLKSLTSGKPELKKLLATAEQNITTYFSSAEEMLTRKQMAFEANEEVEMLKMDFGDMADETVSASYEIEAISQSDNSMEKVGEFTSSIENAVDIVNGALAANIKFEVMSTQSIITNVIGDLRTELDSLASLSDFRGTDELQAMQSVF